MLATTPTGKGLLAPKLVAYLVPPVARRHPVNERWESGRLAKEMQQKKIYNHPRGTFAAGSLEEAD